MPRFFFDVTDGGKFKNEIGENLPSVESARDRAARIASELAQDGDFGASWFR
jgi:hypothetical protein